MIELRKDYVLDRWSYIALDRNKRPQETKNTSVDSEKSKCFFCPGNENTTPPEIGRLPENEKWEVRWFDNKFPAVDKNADIGIEKNDFYIKKSGFGFHEVIVETSDHEKQLADLSDREIENVIKAYIRVMSDLKNKEGIEYVQIFKNSGAKAGTSIEHSHSQIVATSIVPRYVQEKIEAGKKFDKCPYCEIIEKEMASERAIFENERFASFASFAPRFNYEVLVFPKKHYRNITEMDEKDISMLSEVLSKILSKLGEINSPYNMYLHYAPKGEDLHFHFEITPRMNTWAGFELATESYVVTTSPEDAAIFYRE